MLRCIQPKKSQTLKDPGRESGHDVCLICPPCSPCHLFSQSSFSLSYSFLFFLYFYLLSFPPDFCSALGPLCHPTAIVPPHFCLRLSVLTLHACHRTHTVLDICIDSLHFSAHDLTVNRKRLAWISILLSMCAQSPLSFIQLYR